MDDDSDNYSDHVFDIVNDHNWKSLTSVYSIGLFMIVDDMQVLSSMQRSL